MFKKFDRNNLLQVACSDIRERFQYCILLLLVVVQTMKEFGWSEGRSRPGSGATPSPARQTVGPSADGTRPQCSAGRYMARVVLSAGFV